MGNYLNGLDRDDTGDYSWDGRTLTVFSADGGDEVLIMSREEVEEEIFAPGETAEENEAENSSDEAGEPTLEDIMAQLASAQARLGEETRRAAELKKQLADESRNDD